jgi:hypothetical protein
MIAALRTLIIAAFAGLLIGASAWAQTGRPPVRPPAAAVQADDAADQDATNDEDEADQEADEPADQAAKPPPSTPPKAQPQQKVQTAPKLGQPKQPAGAARLQPPGRSKLARPQLAVQPPEDSGLLPLDELTATRERPLFSTTRHPPEPEEKPDAAPQITEGGTMPFELVGIVIGDDVNAAIFRNTESKEETRVAKGEKIGTWCLEDVSGGAVVWRARDKRVRMRLFEESTAPGIKVGRVSGEPVEESPSGVDKKIESEKVDEDIAPTSSPQVKPATAQPKPPPSLRRDQQRRRLLMRQNRRNQQRNNNARD